MRVMLFVLSIFVGSCIAFKSKNRESESHSPIRSIQFERERCRGNCKEYTIQLFADGNCQLNAGVNMPKNGSFKRFLGEDSIKIFFNEIDFCIASVKEYNYPNVSDYQKVRLTVEYQNSKKVIHGIHNVPSCYSEIIEYLDDLAIRVVNR